MASEQTVKSMYKALARGDSHTVAGILASDLEWWFHGPPLCQHMMHVLTGETTHMHFRFDPRRITAIEDRVVVEGWEGDHAYWVHVWTVKEGVITQFREYFNTWLTVRGLKAAPAWDAGRGGEGLTLWRSRSRGHPDRSLPELVLAI